MSNTHPVTDRQCKAVISLCAALPSGGTMSVPETLFEELVGHLDPGSTYGAFESWLPELCIDFVKVTPHRFDTITYKYPKEKADETPKCTRCKRCFHCCRRFHCCAPCCRVCCGD